MPGRQRQPQTGNTAQGNGANNPVQQAQSNLQTVANIAARIPNSLYVSRADFAYDADADIRTKCFRLLKKLLLPSGAVIILVIETRQKTLDSPGYLNPPAHPDPPVHLDPTVHLDPPAHPDLLVNLDPPDPPVHPDPTVHLDPPAHPDLSVNLDPPAHLDPPVHPDPPVHLDLPVNLDSPVHMDPLESVLDIPIGHAFRGICNRAFNTHKSFTAAAAACRADGGTLAMPRDAETNTFLKALYGSVSPFDDFWFGLHDEREEGKFEWIDGTPLINGIRTYSSWSPGQPDNWYPGEDCVHYFPSSQSATKKWNDAPCNHTLGFICQVNPST
ncbi:hypothetical protein Bbelb_405760 [Branchiostoma belcheri]|nr:hypothetical protein Bbelb_405760 [Branchiostoma belcheri]